MFITPHNSWGTTSDGAPVPGDPLAPVRLAQLSEAVGLDLVAFQDHPYQPRFHDSWTLLIWVAGQTDVGARVGAPSRSVVDCHWTSLMMYRCGSPMKPSTRRSMFKAGAHCDAS